jgi:hypothetical protein
MGLDHVRSEIEHMRAQVGRQRKEILRLQRAGIATASAELLFVRMLAKIEGLCAKRDRLKKEQDGRVAVRLLPRRNVDDRLSELVGVPRAFGVACHRNIPYEPFDRRRFVSCRSIGRIGAPPWC